MTNGNLYRLLELLSKFDCTYELDRAEHDAITMVLYIVGREYYTKGLMIKNKLNPCSFCGEEKSRKKKMVYNGVEYDWLFTLKTKRIPIKEEVQDDE